jgi:hypothetical protein
MTLKVDHFLDAHHRHLARFQGQSVTMVEIGVAFGGSIEVWRSYLGENLTIYGVDVDPRCSELAGDRVHIRIGDQADRSFLQSLVQEIPRIDIVIDDGGHTMEQQLATFEVLFPAVAPGGVYICEDAFTSYWTTYGGGLRRAGTFMEVMKDKVDELNAWYGGEAPEPTEFTRTAGSISFYSGMVVIEKGEVAPPRYIWALRGDVGYHPITPPVATD